MKFDYTPEGQIRRRVLAASLKTAIMLLEVECEFKHSASLERLHEKCLKTIKDTDYDDEIPTLEPIINEAVGLDMDIWNRALEETGQTWGEE